MRTPRVHPGYRSTKWHTHSACGTPHADFSSNGADKVPRFFGHLCARAYGRPSSPQVYEQKGRTHDEINELMAHWKLRHVQYMTVKDDPVQPCSFWMRRCDPIGSTHIHVHEYVMRSGEGLRSQITRWSAFCDGCRG